MIKRKAQDKITYILCHTKSKKTLQTRARKLAFLLFSKNFYLSCAQMYGYVNDTRCPKERKPKPRQKKNVTS